MTRITINHATMPVCFLVATAFGINSVLPAVAQSPVIGTGGITSGQATIHQSGSTTDVNQSSQAASINWHSFTIGRYSGGHNGCISYPERSGSTFFTSMVFPTPVSGE